MNSDHADALQLYAHVLLDKQGEGWMMTGIDPEGIDLRAGGAIARLPLRQTCATPRPRAPSSYASLAKPAHVPRPPEWS